MALLLGVLLSLGCNKSRASEPAVGTPLSLEATPSAASESRKPLQVEHSCANFENFTLMVVSYRLRGIDRKGKEVNRRSLFSGACDLCLPGKSCSKPGAWSCTASHLSLDGIDRDAKLDTFGLTSPSNVLYKTKDEARDYVRRQLDTLDDSRVFSPETISKYRGLFEGALGSSSGESVVSAISWGTTLFAIAVDSKGQPSVVKILSADPRGIGYGEAKCAVIPDVYWADGTEQDATGHLSK